MFREQTAWQRYSSQIVLITAILLAQAGLILALLNAHRQRRLAEVQARQRMRELAHVNRFSTAGELTASIAHEINQPLGSILTNTETAQAILKSPNPDLAGTMRITWTLRDVVSGTEVTCLCENIPPGIRPEDNEEGGRSSLAKLAALVE